MRKIVIAACLGLLVIHSGCAISAISRAAIEGNVPEIRRLLADGAKADDHDLLTLETPLHFAANRESLEVVQVLLEAGANPVAKDTSGMTPLGNAAGRYDVEMVRAMLKALPAGDCGACLTHALEQTMRYSNIDIHPVSRVDYAVFGEWCRRGGEIARMLIQKGATPKGLPVHKLVAYPFRVTLSSTPTTTTLTTQSFMGRFDVIKKTTYPALEIQYAVLGCNTELLRLLIAAGADVKAVGVTSRLPLRMTALHVAALLGQPTAIDILLANGAEVDARDETDRTPLQYAAMSLGQAESNSKVVDLLPFARACLRRLLDAGADPTIRSRLGRTALDEYRPAMQKENRDKDQGAILRILAAKDETLPGYWVETEVIPIMPGMRPR